MHICLERTPTGRCRRQVYNTDHSVARLHSVGSLALAALVVVPFALVAIEGAIGASQASPAAAAAEAAVAVAAAAASSSSTAALEAAAAHLPE